MTRRPFFIGMRIKNNDYSNLVAVVWNLALAYVVYMVTRVAYVADNWALLGQGWGDLDKGDLLTGSLRFDSSAIFYTLGLWGLLVLLPLHWKERCGYRAFCKGLYLVLLMVGVVANLADAAYFPYTGRRTTWSLFGEFANEESLAGVIAIETLHHWYFVLLGLALGVAAYFLYLQPSAKTAAAGGTDAPTKPGRALQPLWRYYLVQGLAFVLFVPLAVCAMRGGATRAVRPITISNANQYVDNPQQAAIVLNTPFSMIRTAGKKPFVDPHYMPDDEMEALYTPVHRAVMGDTNSLAGCLEGRNVVVLIVESFGREYIGFYNSPSFEEGRGDDFFNHPGFTPFVDSLLGQSMTWRQTFANGRKSIDAMPSILSSIPMFEEPFFLTTASLNRVSGIAGCLAAKGYSTAFFHGAANGSMGFQAFARATGFAHYYGRTEYDADKRFGGEADFDGNWAIWDEPFLQYYALTMSDMKEPFMTAVFTASSHHPFVIPEQYQSTFAEGTLPMHKCIRYTDYALRRFFETAQQQPWYNNTVFVLTSDHTNMSAHDEYRSSLGLFRAPILIFDPSGTLPRGVRDGVAQQIDIMPTLLTLLGYRDDYVAFGKDLTTGAPHPWAVNFAAGIYQYVLGDYVLLFDGTRPTALYNYVKDPLQQNNLLQQGRDRVDTMTRRLKAIIQSYMQRMVGDLLCC